VINFKTAKELGLTVPSALPAPTSWAVYHHNDDPTTLMCGRPAPYRQGLFAADGAKYFPLSEIDKDNLRRMYPTNWPAAQWVILSHQRRARPRLRPNGRWAMDYAIKAAETDAMMWALVTFGDLFGLAL
jgi:hypothetical protein